MRWQTLYFEDASDRYELKRYAPIDKHYIPHKNYCLSVVKPQYIFDKERMKTEQVGISSVLSRRFHSIRHAQLYLKRM